MVNTELAIRHVQTDSLAPHEARDIALLIERGYNPHYEGELDAREFDNALNGVRQAEHILLGHEDGIPTAVLGASVYTRAHNPEFYNAISKRIEAIEDDNLKTHVYDLMGQIDGLMYTHEMVSLRRGRGDIAALREQALKNAGFDIRNSKIALFGEFQGIDSIGVQRNLPNSVSVLAGVHIPQKGNDRLLAHAETIPLRTLTNIIGETFLAQYHPQTVVHETGAVESQVFDVPPRRSNHLSHPNEFEATRIIEELQSKLEGKGFASAIGATYVNIIATS